MGLFTEIGAALSYNFASGQISKEDEKYVYHQIGRDVSKEEKKYLKFLDKKYGIDKFYIFRLSKILQKYYKEHGEISYKKISKQTGCEKSELKKVMKIMTGYFIKINGENIDYAINNPLKSTTEKDSKIDEENIDTDNHEQFIEKPSEPEEKIHEIEKLLKLLERSVSGEFGENEKHEVLDNAEKWREDITILRAYIEQKIKISKTIDCTNTLAENSKDFPLSSYENISIENKNMEEIKNTEKQRAVREMGILLELLAKKIKGGFEEQDERILRTDTEKWRMYIDILHKHIIQKTEIR